MGFTAATGSCCYQHNCYIYWHCSWGTCIIECPYLASNLAGRYVFMYSLVVSTVCMPCIVTIASCLIWHHLPALLLLLLTLLLLQAEMLADLGAEAQPFTPALEHISSLVVTELAENSSLPPSGHVVQCAGSLHAVTAALLGAKLDRRWEYVVQLKTDLAASKATAGVMTEVTLATVLQGMTLTDTDRGPSYDLGAVIAAASRVSATLPADWVRLLLDVHLPERGRFIQFIDNHTTSLSLPYQETFDILPSLRQPLLRHTQEELKHPFGTRLYRFDPVDMVSMEPPLLLHAPKVDIKVVTWSKTRRE